MAMTTTNTLVLSLLLLPLVGCGKNQGKGEAPAAAPAHVKGTPQTDKVIDSIKSVGLRPEGFAPLEPVPFGASYCEQGQVQGVDTLVCEYKDSATLDQGRKLLTGVWDREGVRTGVTAFSKNTLLAVVDRGSSDPNGKTINQILKAFKKL
jgi:hypothetical protein